LGRWTAADKAPDDGPNGFAYVRCSPIALRDTSGNSAEAAAGAVLTWIATDAAIPESTDLAWPKWLAYAAAGAAAAGPAPITVGEGLSGLELLKSKLSRKELEKRADPFQRAERFIRNAPAGGGVAPPGKSFALPRSDVRVDVEVLRGVNFQR